MKIEISKTDWYTPCNEVWTIIENPSETVVNQLFFETLVRALTNIIKDGDREFLSYSIYMDGEFVARVYDWLDFLSQTTPQSKVSKLFKVAVADTCEYSPVFSDEHDTEYSQYRRQMQERLYE